MTNFENKNCSELLLTNGMGLDGAPVKFLMLVFLRRPTAQYITVSMGSIYIYKKKIPGWNCYHFVGRVTCGWLSSLK